VSQYEDNFLGGSRITVLARLAKHVKIQDKDEQGKPVSCSCQYRHDDYCLDSFQSVLLDLGNAAWGPPQPILLHGRTEGPVRICKSCKSPPMALPTRAHC
jgi:hypothetical protein